jgi:cell division protein FtsB
MTDPYAKLNAAAHSGAFGLGVKRAPTPAQVRAGNYPKGSVRLHGMNFTIETPMFTPRTGKADGEPWSIVCMANYGYLNGYTGADGDAFDVYVGPTPESTLVVVVNQVKKDRTFDEHKAVLGFHDVDGALSAYSNSYERGWQGMGSYVVCSVKQFKAWLKSGDLTRPLEAADLIDDEVTPMTGAVVAWGEDNLPAGMTLGEVMYGLRRSDPDKLLLDSATMADITELLSDGHMLDAMVIEYAQFDRKANQLLRVMKAAASTVKVDAVEVSQPFKNRGTTQVAMLFTMSDGQTVSVFFHNPDSTPNRLTATDELISWKWVLNKKDITVVVAPERGQDISPRQVARRIMTLVEKNSAKFIKASGASAESAAKIEELKGQVQSKVAELQSLDEQVADLQAKVDKLPAPVASTETTPEGIAAKASEYAEQYLAQADGIAEKIKALGGTPLTREEFMAQVASGEQKGFTVDTLTTKLAEHKADLVAVQSGKKTGRSIVGKGGNKKNAIAWLTTTIAETQAAIDSGGILATINASNYLADVSEMLRTLEAQQTAGLDNQDHGNGADDPEAQKIARLLEMLAGARARLADMSSDDAYYGNLVKDIADMAKQLWDAGYRGPEASEVSEQAASLKPDAQPDMLGDDPSLRDNRTDLEKLTAALVAGNAMGALGVLDAIDDVDALRELVLKAGFSLGASGTKDEILAGIGRDLVSAAKAKVDGFGLRDLKKAQETIPAVSTSSTILEDYKDVAALGSATVLSVGAENVYFDKDGKQYMTKLLNTDDFESKVGEVVDLSGVSDPANNDDSGEIEPEGRENTVKTAKGTKVVTGFKVIDAKNLIISHESDGTANPDYPSELQPRDRARATSQAWVQKTARNLDPDSLGRTNRADSGAPIVGKDRVVESGNGRAMAIREAYRIGQADEYRQWLLEHADYFKVSASKIESMKAPVLVRVRVSAVDRAEFAVEANQDDKLAMTATEKARSDAKRLDTAMMAKLADGDLTSAANRDFVSAFLQSLGDAEAAQYMTTDGRPTASLVNRVQAALFAGAYSDDRLLELTADSSKPEIANIVSALNMAAPDFMRAKELDAVGAEAAGEKVTDSLELSLDQEAVNAIINATNVLRKAKDSGMGLDEFLRQSDMFGDVDPSVAAMAMFISKNNRSAKRLGAAFKAMAQFVESEARRKQTAGLFGDEPATFADIVKAANTELEKEFGEGVFAIEQNDLFSQPPAQTAEQTTDEKDTALQKAKAYLDSIIDGSADLGDPDSVMKELERIYAAYGEGELSGLFADAAEAYSQHALKATAEAF